MWLAPSQLPTNEAYQAGRQDKRAQSQFTAAPVSLYFLNIDLTAWDKMILLHYTNG